MKHRFIVIGFCVIGLALAACSRRPPLPPPVAADDAACLRRAGAHAHAHQLLTGGATIDEQNRVIREMVRTAQSRTDIRRVASMAN
jgi:hypothetical protein